MCFAWCWLDLGAAFVTFDLDLVRNTLMVLLGPFQENAKDILVQSGLSGYLYRDSNPKDNQTIRIKYISNSLIFC